MVRLTDTQIYQLACRFKRAIEEARDSGCFSKDLVFGDFPHACCGDTCCLFAEYLRNKGVQTIYVWGDCGDQSHAWLVIKDHRICEPKKRSYAVPDDMREILSIYNGKPMDSVIDITRYEEDDLIDGLIVDITADQFGEIPIYVGKTDDFHRHFLFENATDYCNLGDMRLNELYSTILRFM